MPQLPLRERRASMCPSCNRVRDHAQVVTVARNSVRTVFYQCPNCKHQWEHEDLDVLRVDIRLAVESAYRRNLNSARPNT